MNSTRMLDDDVFGWNAEDKNEINTFLLISASLISEWREALEDEVWK